jgi:hypothetical protein
MKPMRDLLNKIHEASRKAWLTFVQLLNVIAMALVGSAAVVNLTYPDVIRGLLSRLPPLAAASLLFVFGAIVHYGTQRAKRAQ